MLQNFCIDRQPEIEYIGVPVGKIKKHATGKGNAGKPAMVEAARRLYPDANIKVNSKGEGDDDHADALCLLHFAQETYGGE